MIKIGMFFLISTIHLFCVLCVSTAFSREIQQKIIVNIPVFTPNNSKIYITGNFSNCMWKVDCIELKKMDQHRFTASLNFKFNFPSSKNLIQYKVTRGSWASEEILSTGILPKNHLLSAEKKTTVISIANWADLKPLQVVGQLKIFSLYSKQLQMDETIRVWLPPSYDLNTKKSFPVIYAHDGQNLFDPQIARFKKEWTLDETLYKLIKEKKIPEVMVVAIDSPYIGQERSDRFNYFVDGKKYSNFIVQTLIPYINANYRTIPNRENTFLLGSSFGATISFTTLFDFPNVFSKAALISLPVFAQNRSIFSFLRQFNRAKLPVRAEIYVDHGGVGYDQHYKIPVQLFLNKLIKKGFYKEHIIYEQFPYADHSEVDWARRLDIPLRFLLNAKSSIERSKKYTKKNTKKKYK